MGTMIIYMAIAMFIVATIWGVIEGILKTYIRVKKIKSGISFEEIQREEQRMYEEKKDAEKKKYESKLYCIFHPLGWLNNYIEGKIKTLKKG